MPSAAVCREIHSITQGSPYEVMLTSHFAFRELLDLGYRVPMSISPGVLADVAEQLRQQNPTVEDAVRRIRSLTPSDAETLRELIELDGCPIERFAFSELPIDGDPSQTKIAEARRQVESVIDHAAKTGFVASDGERLKVVADPFEKSLIKYSVLGGRVEEDATPKLFNPGLILAGKGLKSMQAALTRGLQLQENDVVAELGSSNSSARFILAFNDKLKLDLYDTEVATRIEIGGTWHGLLLITRRIGPGQRDRVRELVAQEARRLDQFEIEVSDIKVRRVNRSAFSELVSSEESSRVQVAVGDAREAFNQGRPDMADAVTRACTAVLEEESPDGDDVWQHFNDCAFMALSTELSGSYRQLSDKALSFRSDLSLTLATRALWEATEGRYDSARDFLGRAEQEVEGSDEHFVEDVVMYSPAGLARTPASIEFDDVMARLQLVDVIRSYDLAISAAETSSSVADALAGCEEPKRWILGAAADAAEYAGDPEGAADFRRRAADLADKEDSD